MQKHEAVILLAEINGFQSLVEDLSAGDAQLLMNELLTLFDTTVKLHHGTISRFTGDTVLAVFIGPKNKSVAIRAIDSAFELKERLSSNFTDNLPDREMRPRMAITSGQVISASVGAEGNQQTTLMGGPVNDAGRICQFAEENQVLVDKAVYDTSHEHFEFQTLEPIPVNGGSGSLAIFEPLKKKRKKLEVKKGTERKIHSEMVGREKEFEILYRQIRELKKGKGSIINLVGKAGMGKSRLMAEMKAQTVLEEVALYEGRGLSTGANLSFHPVIHILKSWAGILEEDTHADSYDKLHQAIERIAPGLHDEIFPFIATMMGLPLKGAAAGRVKGIEGESMEKLILKNLRDLLIEATAKRPVIIVLEDLHWADTSSINLLKSLYKLVNDHPILFINLLRPGYENTGDLITRHVEDNFSTTLSIISIGALPDQQSRELITNLLLNASLPENVSEMVIKKSEGNPFFIEEIIRSFLDQKIIEFENNAFRVSGKIEQIDIPETINDVILSRVDKLDEKTKELLKTAAVIGRNFYFKILEEAADTIGELDERLQYLKEAQFINEGETKDEIEYLFKHALAQQATYDSILTEKRKELHLKIARSIEKVFADNLHEFYGTLASHYEQAGNPGKTEEYLKKAGDMALRKGASAEAITFYKEALRHYTANHSGRIDNKQVADLEEKLAISLFINGRQIECVEYFEKVQAFYGLRFPKRKLHKIIRTLINLIHLMWLLWFSGENRKREATEIEKKLEKIYIMKGHALISFDGRRLFFEYLNIARMMNRTKISSLRYGVGNLISLSALFVWTGIAYKLGHAIFRLAQKNLGDEDVYSWLQVNFQCEVNKYFSGNTGDPHPIDHNVYIKGLANGEYWQTMIYYVFNSLIQAEKGDKQRVSKCLDYIQKVGDAFDNNYCYAQHYRCLSNYLVKTRDIGELIEVTDRGVDYIKNTDHHGMLLMISCARSIGFSLRGEMDKARENLDKADEIFKKFSIKLHASHCLIARTYYEKALLGNTSDEIEKREIREQLLKTAAKSVKTAKRVLPHLTEACRLQANALILDKQYARALKAYKNSIEAAGKFGSRLELSRTYFDLGKFLSDPKMKHRDFHGHTASHYLEKAKSMFEEMELHADLTEYKDFIS